VVDEGLLHRVQGLAVGQALDRRDPVADRDREQQAGVGAPAADEDDPKAKQRLEVMQTAIDALEATL